MCFENIDGVDGVFFLNKKNSETENQYDNTVNFKVHEILKFEMK